MQDLYTEKYKLLLRVTNKKKKKKIGDLHTTFINQNFNTINKLSMLPKLFYRVNAILMKIPASFLLKTKKPILKFISKGQEPRTAKTILKKKDKIYTICTTHFQDFTINIVVINISKA